MIALEKVPEIAADPSFMYMMENAVKVTDLSVKYETLSKETVTSKGWMLDEEVAAGFST